MDDQNQQIPQQPAQPEIQPQQSNSNWLRTLSIGLGVIGIGLVIGIGGYILGAKKSQPVQNQPISITPTAVHSNEISDPTANWKTYTSEEYKFTIKYPSNVLHETTFGTTQFNKSHELFKINGGILEIYGVCGRGIQPIKSQDITIASQKTQKLYETLTSGAINAITRLNSSESICFNFSLPTEPNTQKVDVLFDQILSTFKFTN